MTAATSTGAVPVRRLHARPQAVHFEANAAARAEIAARFGLRAVARLEADVELRRSGQTIVLTGDFHADVVQNCVVSGEPVPASPGGPLHLRFEPLADAGDDIELDADMLDTLPLAGDSVDIAEAVAQSLYLALDPYPRASAAVLSRYRQYLQPEPDPAAAASAETRRPFAGLRQRARKSKDRDAGGNA